jgi:hypothetical protein
VIPLLELFLGVADLADSRKRSVEFDRGYVLYKFWQKNWQVRRVGG